MALLTLKRYQQQSLDELDKYLRAARLKGPRLAFEAQTGYGYNAEPFGEVPCVCLRIPTGGGKTVLAAHAVPMLAREWQGSDAPVIAVSDYVRAVPESVRAFITAPYVTLGTDGFGRSDTRANLRDFFEVDAKWIAYTALVEKFAGQKTPAELREIANQLGLDLNQPLSTTV